MGTRSNIGILNEDGTIDFVYAHWDGYPQKPGNGSILFEHYTEEAKVQELVGLGSLSSLGAEIRPDPDAVHAFSDAQKGVTVFYGRDRGETGKHVAPLTAQGFAGVRQQEYAYVFVPDGDEGGSWRWCGHNSVWGWLTEEDVAEDSSGEFVMRYATADGWEPSHSRTHKGEE